MQDGKIFIVDLDGFLPLPESMRKSHEIEFLTHACGNIYSHDAKMLLAQELLDRYKNEAELVITSRLHCALPCIAMGIPVLLFADPNSERMKLATEIIPIHPYNIINNIYTIGISNSYPTLRILKKFVKQVLIKKTFFVLNMPLIIGMK
ncbi:MAG: polysaccharide pyruvyl transferase family protein [Arenicellales bacterium WSBS_2016_MAG_OTU3]